MAEILTRFAPSPTGHLHIGGARTALFCWALAHGADTGRFLLRIEDTDQKRSSESAAAGILQDLAWLGIHWDEGPEWRDLQHNVTVGGDPRKVGSFYQSKRLEIYQRYFNKLLDAGIAYPAFESAEELTMLRIAAEKEKRSFIYRRHEGYNHAQALARMPHEPHVLRFAVPPAPVVVHDAVLGEVTFPYEEIDDLVIRKADGMPTYHFAVVVDDELMDVTHILRGQEHLNNTPRHVAMQQVLGFRKPVFAHLPLIFNADGSKMSKRDKDKAAKAAWKQAEPALRAASLGDASGPTQHEVESWASDKAAQLPSDKLRVLASHLAVELPEIDVEDFRRAGYLPEVVCNYLSLLGWSKGDDIERFDMEEFARRFTVERIGKTAAKFDRDKLLSFNFDTIQSMDPALLARRWREWCDRYDRQVPEVLGDRMELAAKAARQRAKTLRQLREPLGFVFTADDAVVYDQKAVEKVLVKGEGLEVLRAILPFFELLTDWTSETIEHTVHTFAEHQGLGMGKVAQPLRVALTGAAVSPGLGDTLALLGKQSVLSRITRCLQKCG
jgi:glutamyl/glutaminyl-tRNA synthetase